MSAHRTQTPSPGASREPRSVSPAVLGQNLQVDGGSPESLLPAHLVPKPLLDAWNDKYNRSSMRLMTEEDFEGLIASIKGESNMSTATDVELEAALAERLQRDTTRLQSQLSDMKTHVLLDLDRDDGVANLLPLIRQDTQHGWSRYILQTLSIRHQTATSHAPATSRLVPPTSSALKRRRASSSLSATTEPRPAIRERHACTQTQFIGRQEMIRSRSLAQMARVRKTRKSEATRAFRRTID